MDSLWLLLGVGVLAATLADVFLSALNFDESGFLAGRVARVQWRLLRRVTRRLPRRWRPAALRQVTGLQVVVMVAVWVCGTILGYGLIYYSQMSPSTFSTSGGDRELNFFDALYFSAAQLATVGGSVLTASTDPLRFLSILESLTGVVLISLILTFLLGVYDVIGSLNTLCRQFSSAERGVGSAVASLAPHFHDGQVDGLDSHLDAVSDALTSYMDGLRLHHAAYYFQSGRDQFALPYALSMVGGTIGALNWGLPTGHPASVQASLPPLTYQFLEFTDQLQDLLRWSDRQVPEVVPHDVFAAHAGDGVLDSPRDRWVTTFLGLNAQMARLAGVEPLADMDDVYRRYSRWLPFAYRSQSTTLAVSDDLDYQPLIVTDMPVSVLREHSPVVLESVEVVPGVTPWAVRQDGTKEALRPDLGLHLLRERAGQVDPGHVRLRAATRALLASGGTVATLFVVFDALGDDQAVPAAIFGGFAAMLSTGLANAPGLRERRLASLVAILPVWLVLLLGALTSGEPWWRAALLVVVALAGTGARRFGPLAGALGGVTFMTFYFALILRLDLSDVPFFAAAALVGVVWSYVCSYVLLPDRPLHMLQQGVEALTHQMTTSVATLVDAVSWARWDPDIRQRVAVDMKRTHRTAAFVAGQLARETSDTEAIRMAEGLRLRVFDAELAMVNLKNAARGVTGTTLSLQTRGRLGGMLETLRADLTSRLAQREPGWTAGPPALDTPSRPWPTEALNLVKAAQAFHSAVLLLAAWQSDPHAVDPLDPHDPEGDAALADLAVAGAGGDAAKGRFQPWTRRSVQTAVATALSLAVGAAISGAHQFWAVLAAYQTLGSTDGETLSKGSRRVAGTVVGAAAGFAIATVGGGRGEIVVPVLAVALFASVYYRPVASGVATFWTTLIFAGIYEYLGRLTTVAIEQRILETFLGAMIALCVAWWVLPTRTRSRINKDITTLTRDLQLILSGSFERLTSREEIPRSAVQKRLLGIDHQVRDLNADAAPLRHTIGSYETGGIEALLTAVWSLTSITRELVHTVERTRTEHLDTDGPDWPQVRQTIEQNLAALLTALSDRVPAEVVTDLPPVDEATLTPGAREVHDLADLTNQTILALVELVAPESDED
ncbi:FUSC family protein [Nocardioides jishulii]|uniref:Uncharacterized protein n=1 Tax=Nocardioides jishulii TaxID=2575440 RepID=A0A4U2YPP2_9ACTN|nr:FUSC family protein [Nocardioides jishulii]QCX27828.1 hypothetical protein FCL41_10060 [Nocardioides jishulii]TKI62635.1 hypothetical protein FC770_09725 [Nocardioides jishulii]